MATRPINSVWSVSAEDFASESVEIYYSIDGGADVKIDDITTTALYDDDAHPLEITWYLAEYNYVIPDDMFGRSVTLKIVDPRQVEEPVEFGPYDITNIYSGTSISIASCI